MLGFLGSPKQPKLVVEDIDLFDSYELLPKSIQKILLVYGAKDNTYKNCERLLKRLEPLGYTFDYGLDAVPFGLKKIVDNSSQPFDRD